MTTAAVLTLSAILLAFLAIVAMMIRKSMHSGEDLREELKNSANAITQQTDQQDDAHRYLDQSAAKDADAAPIELINSTDSLREFLQKEKLVKASIFQQVRIYDRLARDIVEGKRNIKIDLDNVPSHTHPGKLEASVLFIGLERRLKEMQNLTPYSYTYRVVAVTAIVIMVLALVVRLLVDAR